MTADEIDDLRRLMRDCCDLFDLTVVELNVAGVTEVIRRHPAGED